MRTVYLLALIGAAILMHPNAVVAQDKATGLLNAFEVQQLVSRAEPADNARLGAHFAALANRYTAEANKHISMSQSFAGNPSRNLGIGMSDHCKRLADLNTQSAATARELATYHEKLAAGTRTALPADAARFQGGAGAPEPTVKELKALAAKDNTTMEHRALEEYFVTLAKRYTAAANEHVALAQTYRGTRIASAAVHQDHLAALARDEANEATAAAEMHKQLAGVAR